MALFRGKQKKRTHKKKPARRPSLDRRLLFIRRAVIIVIIAAIVFFLFIRQNARFGEYTIGSLWAPVQNVFNSAARHVKTFVSDWHNYDTLKDEYETLTQENERLSLELSNSEEISLENERLKDLLDAKNAYDSLDPIYARIISRNTSQWLTTFSINRGEINGVEEGMAVVNGSGLIGRIYKVGLNYSDVVTIIDTRSGVGCLVQRTRDAGIMRGGVANDADQDMCYVYYLPNTSSVMPGDTVVTSGTDATYPKGITIGSVIEVSLEAGAEGNYALVQPNVDFQHLEEVMVLRSVVEKASDAALPALPTATPSPTLLPAATPENGDAATPAPQATDDLFSYPTPAASSEANAPSSSFIESIPEDAWAEQ